MHRLPRHNHPCIAAPTCILLWSLTVAWLFTNIHAQDGWQRIPEGRWRPLAPAVGVTNGFTLLPPDATGLVFTNALNEFAGATNRVLYNGSGIATSDVDADGLPDVFVASLEGHSVLYRNLGNFRFTNITEQAGIDTRGLIVRGATFADVNGDHRPDLLLTTVGHGVRLYLNSMPQGFVDATEFSGTASAYGSATVTLADIDGNGTLDLYVANNRAEDVRDRGSVDLKMSQGRVVVPPALQDRFVIVDGQIREYGEPDQLFLGDGNGRFTPVSWTQGAFLDEQGVPLTRPPLDWGLTAAFQDLNGDGAPDLYVCNDYWTPDRIWMNDGKGRFRAAPLNAVRHISGSSMGVDFADINRDGLTDIFAVDMLSRHLSWRKRQRPAQPAEPPSLNGLTDRPQTLRNTLFLNRGDGTFAEVAGFAGLTASEWAWQPLFLDVDLDGYEDLLITSGYPHDVQDMDAEVQVQARGMKASAIRDPVERRRQFQQRLFENMQLYPPLHTEVLAFRNQGNLRFEEMTSAWGTQSPGIHNGIALADFDGDGDLDVVVNRLRDSPALYRNNAGNPRVAVRLFSDGRNSQGVGARVTLRGGKLPVQSKEIVAGGHYASGSDPVLQFATGGDPEGLTLEVQWRSGTTTTVSAVRAGRLYVLNDPSPGTATAARRPSAAPPAAPLFTDASQFLNHTHVDAAFDDFSRQPLLPRKLSHPGPGVVCDDIDNDGRDDLVLTSGNGGSLAVFLTTTNPGALFRRLTNTLPALRRDQTAAVSHHWGTNTTVWVSSANDEDGSTNGFAIVPFGLPGPRGVPPAVGPGANAGPLCLADMDGDGTPDLFLGMRATPGFFPEARASRLLKWSGDRWVPHPQSTPALEHLGIVNGAVWTDLDDTGLPDLLVATEWGAIHRLKNQHGVLTNQDTPIQWENGTRTRLAALTGLWQGIVAADFDGDGRMDFAASNWGENNDPNPTLEHPLTLHFAPLSGSAHEIVEGVYDPEQKAQVPVWSLEVLGRSIPSLSDHFKTFKSFSEAALTPVIAAAGGEWKQRAAACLQSMVFLNRQSHFIAIPLPTEAQLSPAFGIVAGDFNGDGIADLFLAQNFFGVRPQVTRWDAGRGLMLLGKGDGHFRALSATESGIAIDGEMRGAAAGDFNQDGRLDLVVSQNNGPTRLLLNQQSRPLLRVRLQGSAMNPRAIGARVRWTTSNGAGTVWEIQAGSGFCSQNSSTLLLPIPATAGSISIRWPNGKPTTHAVSSESLHVEFSEPVGGR